MKHKFLMPEGFKDYNSTPKPKILELLAFWCKAREWLIDPKDLDTVEKRKPGRPKSRKSMSSDLELRA